jgi:GNAT superfamily N-acetyltransferase
MPHFIRPYDVTDYPTLFSWWQAARQAAPPQKLIPLGSTFLIETDSIPALSVSVFITNAPIAYVEHFIGNSQIPAPVRHLLGQRLLEHIQGFARSFGAEWLICHTYVDGLVRRYQEMGWQVNKSGGTSLLLRA